jgi:hypothetical protein
MVLARTSLLVSHLGDSVTRSEVWMLKVRWVLYS